MAAHTITGRLLQRARASTGPLGDAYLQLRIDIRAAGEPAAVRCDVLQHLGTGTTAQHVAHLQAARLREGATVTVHAQQLVPKGRPLRLLAQRVERIDLHDDPAAARTRAITGERDHPAEVHP